MLYIKQGVARQRHCLAIHLHDALMFHLLAVLLKLEFFHQNSSGEVFSDKGGISMCIGFRCCMFVEDNVNQNSAPVIAWLKVLGSLNQCHKRARSI